MIIEKHKAASRPGRSGRRCCYRCCRCMLSYGYIYIYIHIYIYIYFILLLAIGLRFRQSICDFGSRFEIYVSRFEISAVDLRLNHSKV